MTSNPALDAAAVAAQLPSFQLRKERALTGIRAHISDAGGYVAWSGGRDSTAVVSLARIVDPQIPVVWFDSGLEFPETREYVSQIAARLRLNLHVIQVQPSALEILQSSGAWDHSAMFVENTADIHDALIGAPSREAHRRFGHGELTGLRAEESLGRRALLAPHDGHYRRKDGSVVLAPLWSWSSRNVSALLRSEGIPENPVYGKLIALGAPERALRVGLVVDGNNPHHGRYTYLRAGWPTLWNDLVQALPRLNEWR